MSPGQPRVFFGWIIVLASALGLFLGAPLVVFSFAVFFKPLVADFHASRAAISLAFSLSNLAGALWLPGTGVLIDRFGAKRVILVSMAVFGVTLCCALWMGSALWQLYLLYAVLGVAMASGPAPVPHTAVISHWFDRRRGLALSLSMMGIGVGSIAVPMLSQRLIAMYGWRMAMAIFGAAVLLVPLPVVAGLLQNDPAQRGLQPDGDGELRTRSPQPTQERNGLSWTEIWPSPTFWLLLAIFSLVGISVHGAALHMSAVFTDRGVSPERAAMATSLVGAAVIVGRLGSGYLLDVAFAPRVAMLFYGATALGISMLCTGIHGVSALAAAFLTGLGMGAEVECMGYMVSRYFGLRAFGTAYGVAFGAFMVSGSAGVLLMGAGFDRFHSYTAPLAALTATMIVGLLLLTRLGPYRYGVEPEHSGAVETVELPSSA